MASKRHNTSNPVSIPGGFKNSNRKRSILKNSVDSDYCQTPEASTPTSSRGTVRFNEDNVATPDYYLYDAKCIGGQAIISPMAAFRKIADSKFKNQSLLRKRCDSDSLNGEEGSADEEEDRVSVRSASPSVLHFSTSMSAEAQYALLQAYEDELHDRLTETFPEVSERIENIRSYSPDPLKDSDFLDVDQVSTISLPNPHTVANRLQMAMDIMDSVRESQGEEIAMGSSHSRSIAKDPVRSFEKWCRSVRDALEDLSLNHHK